MHFHTVTLEVQSAFQCEGHHKKQSSLGQMLRCRLAFWLQQNCYITDLQEFGSRRAVGYLIFVEVHSDSHTDAVNTKHLSLSKFSIRIPAFCSIATRKQTCKTWSTFRATWQMRWSLLDSQRPSLTRRCVKFRQRFLHTLEEDQLIQDLADYKFLLWLSVPSHVQTTPQSNVSHKAN